MTIGFAFIGIIIVSIVLTLLVVSSKDSAVCDATDCKM